MMNHFDLVAKTWDVNPIHTARTKAIAAEMLKRMALRKEMIALEYGSGTGLLSFALSDQFSKITLMDNSVEMHKQAVGKIQESRMSHLFPMLFDLEKEEYTGEKFDIIFSQMVMHHVENVEGIFQKFYHMLNPGGWLAIADLYTEDGRFHDHSFHGHKGFDPGYMEKVTLKAGFENPELQPCFEVKKEEEQKPVKVYPVFLLVAEKK